ncbi:NADPH-dependent F420 reductase [Corynebacterium marquesiae]
MEQLSLGIYGSGKLGTAIAKRAVSVGLDVVFALKHFNQTNVYHCPKTGFEFAPPSVIANKDLILLAIPINNLDTLESTFFKGKTVIDAMNHWPPEIEEFEEWPLQEVDTSSLVQEFLSEAKVVKTLNHISYHDLYRNDKNGQRKQTLMMAGDDLKAKQLVRRFIEAIDFELIDIGPLQEGIHLQPGGKFFGVDFKREN